MERILGSSERLKPRGISTEGLRMLLPRMVDETVCNSRLQGMLRQALRPENDFANIRNTLINKK